jgi:DNA polymerase elongation subunit (family B)
MEILNILAKESDPAKLTDLLPEILELLQERLTALNAGEVPLEELVVTHTLSREPERYSVLSASAVVAKQLLQNGKTVKRGQRIRFIYIAPAPGAWAWDLPQLPNPKTVDRIRYRELFLRASLEILQPLGVTEAILKNWLFGEAGYLAPPGLLKSNDPIKLALPLFADINYLSLSN